MLDSQFENTEYKDVLINMNEKEFKNHVAGQFIKLNKKIDEIADKMVSIQSDFQMMWSEFKNNILKINSNIESYMSEENRYDCWTSNNEKHNQNVKKKIIFESEFLISIKNIATILGWIVIVSYIISIK